MQCITFIEFLNTGKRTSENDEVPLKHTAVNKELHFDINKFHIYYRLYIRSPNKAPFYHAAQNLHFITRHKIYILLRCTKSPFYHATQNLHFITLHKISILSRHTKSPFYHAAQNLHFITLQNFNVFRNLILTRTVTIYVI